jgi:putative membrane protein
MQGDADKLAKSAKITPTAPSSATQLKQESKAAMDSLKAAKGATFDQQYIAGQVADHQKALDNLKSYQGTAQNADLKNLIQNAIPKVQQHLDRARDLQGKLGTKA